MKEEQIGPLKVTTRKENGTWTHTIAWGGGDFVAALPDEAAAHAAHRTTMERLRNAESSGWGLDRWLKEATDALAAIQRVLRNEPKPDTNGGAP